MKIETANSSLHRHHHLIDNTSFTTGSNSHQGYYYPPYAYDIRILLLSFLQHQTYSFKVFKEVWKKLHFSSIHYFQPRDVTYEDWMETLHIVALGYLLDQPMEVKIAVVYALYCLFDTGVSTLLTKQDDAPVLQRKRVDIRICPSLYREILNVRKFVVENDIRDCCHVLNRLAVIHAFRYVAFVPIDPICSKLDMDQDIVDAKVQENLERSSILTKSLPFRLLKEAEEKYNELKWKLVENLKKNDLLEGSEKDMDPKKILETLHLNQVDEMGLREIRRYVGVHVQEKKNRFPEYQEELYEEQENMADVKESLQTLRKKRSRKRRISKKLEYESLIQPEFMKRENDPTTVPEKEGEVEMAKKILRDQSYDDSNLLINASKYYFAEVALNQKESITSALEHLDREWDTAKCVSAYLPMDTKSLEEEMKARSVEKEEFGKRKREEIMQKRKERKIQTKKTSKKKKSKQLPSSSVEEGELTYKYKRVPHKKQLKKRSHDDYD